MTKTLRPQFGSISHGTLREQDLIPAFLDELARLNPKRAKEIKWEYADLLTALDADEGFDEESAGYLLNEVLHESLDECCMPFQYFGAHAGDGSDFGFWFDSNAFETAESDGELVKVSELPSRPELRKLSADVYYVAVISDHGNIELYTRTGRHIYGIV